MGSDEPRLGGVEMFFYRGVKGKNRRKKALENKLEKEIEKNNRKGT
jgi:hypothetical protein